MSLKIVILAVLVVSTIQQKGNMKALELRKLALKSENGLIKFDSQKFEYFVT